MEEGYSSNGRVAEQPVSSLPLSPVMETQEDSTLEEDRFADALNDFSDKECKEGHMGGSKRDSKFEDDFEDAHLQIVEISEQAATEDESMSQENLTSGEKETAPVQQYGSTHTDDTRQRENPVYPSQSVLILLVTGLCLSVLLVSLDRTIVTTAIPAITNEFGSTSTVGWYGSAYLVTACALQPTYGKIYTLFDVKWTFLHSVVIFEIGSLLCAVAQNSTTLIIGRAIAGWGSAGILTGAFVVVAYAVPLHKRPIFTASIGIMYGVGAAAGPVLGGVFTGMVTWRWCFYFNLPVGSVTLVAIVFFFKSLSSARSRLGYVERLRQIDITGSILVLISFTMLFLALEYNTSGYSWSSSRIIGLLCGFAITLLIFLSWQWYRQEKALIMPSLVLTRTVGAACVLAFFIYAVLILHGYFLPIWFQAIKGTSTINSGVDMLTYVVPNSIFSLLTGIFISRVGYFTPPAIIGCAITTAGSGLISTIQPLTSTSTWAGFVCLVAAGVGMAIQQSFTAVQSVLPLEHIPVATAAITCFQSLGGAVFVSIGNSLLSNELRKASQTNELAGIDIAAILSTGATQFRSTIPSELLPAVLDVYNGALQKVFIAAIPIAGFAFISTLFMEWRNIKGPKSDVQSDGEDIDPDEPPVLPDIEIETRISPGTTRLGIASRSHSSQETQS